MQTPSQCPAPATTTTAETADPVPVDHWVGVFRENYVADPRGLTSRLLDVCGDVRRGSNVSDVLAFQFGRELRYRALNVKRSDLTMLHARIMTPGVRCPQCGQEVG